MAPLSPRIIVPIYSGTELTHPALGAGRGRVNLCHFWVGRWFSNQREGGGGGVFAYFHNTRSCPALRRRLASHVTPKLRCLRCVSRQLWLWQRGITVLYYIPFIHSFKQCGSLQRNRCLTDWLSGFLYRKEQESYAQEISVTRDPVRPPTLVINSEFILSSEFFSLCWRSVAWSGKRYLMTDVKIK